MRPVDVQRPLLAPRRVPLALEEREGVDPTLAPMYTKPTDPLNDYYPGGGVSVDAFLWLVFAL